MTEVLLFRGARLEDSAVADVIVAHAQPLALPLDQTHVRVAGPGLLRRIDDATRQRLVAQQSALRQQASPGVRARGCGGGGWRTRERRAGPCVAWTPQEAGGREPGGSEE